MRWRRSGRIDLDVHRQGLQRCSSDGGIAGQSLEAFAFLQGFDEIDWLRRALRRRKVLQRQSSCCSTNGRLPKKQVMRHQFPEHLSLLKRSSESKRQDREYGN